VSLFRETVDLCIFNSVLPPWPSSAPIYTPPNVVVVVVITIAITITQRLLRYCPYRPRHSPRLARELEPEPGSGSGPGSGLGPASLPLPRLRRWTEGAACTRALAARGTPGIIHARRA
jgi:hypothetical protein